MKLLRTIQEACLHKIISLKNKISCLEFPIPLLWGKKLALLKHIWTDIEAETPILGPPDAKGWLIGKTLMLGKIKGKRRG